MIFSNNFSEKKLSKLFGLDKDREGIITRFINEKDNWETHLNNSKKYILSSAENKKKKTAVVLGSGWWLDLPYIELSKMFKKLYFIDISHPNQIKHKVKQFPNIELITADISGTFKTIYNLKKNKSYNLLNDFKIDINNFGLPKNISIDFMVSLNLLNQLSYFPKSYLLKNGLISEKEVIVVTQKIEDMHLKSLLQSKSCIITDFHQFEYNFNDVLQKETKRTLAKIPTNKSRKDWIWDFDLSGNFINNRKVKFNVAALQV